MSSRHWSRKKFWGIYTLVFAVCFIAAFEEFARAGRSFVWNVDGEPQYIPYLSYIGTYLRNWWNGILRGQFTHLMFDFTIGTGSDVGAVFRPHPLDFLSAFVPAAYTEILYHVILITRMYLGGASFCLYQRYLGRNDWGILTGSAVYVFCGYTMTLGVEHTTFLSALIVLPLLFLGARRILDGRDGLPFSLVTTLGFFCNYYFMYMCTIAMAFYVLFHLPEEIRQRGFGSTVVTVIRMVGYYLLGVCLAAIVLLPIARGLGASARLTGEVENGSMLLYADPERYFRWFSDLIVPHRGTGSNTYFNYLAIALPALAVFAVLRSRAHRRVAAGLLVCLAAVLVPAAGYVMGGFANVNNRWIFILGFLIADVVVLTAEDLTDLRGKPLAAALIVSAVYIGAAFWQYLGTRNLLYAVGILELLLCLAGLLAISRVRFLRQCGGYWMLLGTVMLVFCHGFSSYNWHFTSYLKEFLRQGTAMSKIESSAQSRLSDIVDEGFYRSDTSVATSTLENYPVVLGYFGTSMYNSLLPGAYVEYLYEQENIGLDAIHRIFGLDARTAAEALANVRYYLTKTENTEHLPYGFSKVDALSDETYSVWMNRYPLPFGYSYDRVIGPEEYEKLSAIEKQEVMLFGALLEDTDSLNTGQISTLSGCPLAIREQSITPDILDEGVIIEGDTVQIPENETGFTLRLEQREGYEYYLRFAGFSSAAELTRVDLSAKGYANTVSLRRKGGTYSTGREDYLVLLGTAKVDREVLLSVTFRAAGTYHLSGMSIVAVPMDGYAEAVRALSAQHLEDYAITQNVITGSATFSSDRVLTLSVPYSDGWEIWLDGEKTQLLRVNTAYIGCLVPAGTHTIRAVYTSPGTREGMLVSGISLLAVIAAGISGRRRRQRGRAASTAGTERDLKEVTL